jgi:hypothetical protein
MVGGLIMLRRLALTVFCLTVGLMAQPPNVNPGGGTGGSGVTFTATVAAAALHATGGGTAQAQTATYSPAITSLTQGLSVCWLPAALNTGANPTFSPNGLTATVIVKAPAGSALVAGDISTLAEACAIYDLANARWELQNPQQGNFSPLIPTSPNGSVVIGNTGTATPTLDVSTTYLNSLYCQLFGCTFTGPIITSLSAGSGGIQLTAGALPTSVQPAGVLLMDATGVMGKATGTNDDALWSRSGSPTAYGAPSTAGKILQATDTVFHATDVAMSGDATIAVGGAVTVAKINGVGVSGTPSIGYVPTATSSTTATWQAQSGGGPTMPAAATAVCLWEHRYIEGTGTTVADGCGNGNTGTFSTGHPPAWAADGSGITDDGTQNYTIPAGNTSGTIPANIKTIVVAYIPNIYAAATNNQVLTEAMFSNGVGYPIFGLCQRNLTLFCGASGSNDAAVAGNNKSVGPTVTTFTLPGGNNRIWQNGREVSGYMNANALTFPTSAGFMVGDFTDGGGFGMSGTYLYSAGFSTALTASQIAAMEQYVEQRILLDHGVRIVDNNPTSTQVITHGDSISSNEGNNGYLGSWQQFIQDLIPIPYNIQPLGLGGQTLSTMVTRMPTVIQGLIKQYAPAKSVVVNFGGSNDLATGGTAAATYSSTQSYSTNVHSYGGYNVTVTILSRVAPTDTNRGTLNASIAAGFLNGTLATDAVAFWGNDPNMGQNGNYTTTWYADATHPSVAGNALGATYIAPAVMRAVGQGDIAICNRFSIGVNGTTNWTIAANGHTSGPGVAISAATTQAVPLWYIGPKYKLTKVSVKTTTAWSGTGFTTLTATIGDSVGGTTYYLPGSYDMTAAVSNTNFSDSVLLKSATWAGSNLTLALTANQNLNANTLTGGLDITACVASIP